ncbi:MAG: 2-aminobenzoate-CoA ligase [Rhodospirillaceae bacterium]|nr:2-aminobenzoate-CoA ligase [Rhodospirillaceae bacterium]
MSLPKSSPGAPTAYVDTFAQDHLPPEDLIAEVDYSGTPELVAYPNYLNVATVLLDDMVATGFGDNPAVHLGDVTWTYSGLLTRANQIARILIEDCGMVTGNRVLIRSPNTPMMVACWFGILKAGGVCVSTMPMLRARELSYVIDKAKVDFLFCDIDLQEEMAEAADEKGIADKLFYFKSTNADREGATLEAMMAEKEDSFTNVETAADDVALIAFTSGTTGNPKAPVHFHRDILQCADTFGRYIATLTPDDVVTGTPPLAFTFGLGGLLICPLRFGASCRYLEGPMPEQILETIQKYKVTQLYTAPTAYRVLTDLVRDFDISSLRQCISAGETLPKATFDVFFEATGIKIIDGLGSTEMFHVFVAAEPAEMRGGFTGKAVPGFMAKVMDDKGKEADPGTPGMLAVRGPSACKYLDDPEKQLVYSKDGWNYPGDVYEMDNDGYFKYVARGDDMIISSGYNISGPEIEAVLLEHAVVAECAVVASPDPDRGNIVKAFIVLREGVYGDAELVTEIQNFIKNEMAPYKYPRAVEFINELPKTATGKVQRFKLRQLESG